MLKKTKTRNLVFNFLNSNQNPLSANDIYENLKDNNVTLSSIYRTLDTFTQENIIIKDMDNLGTALYSLHKKNHCHFLECKECHKKIKIPYCPYHEINEEIKEKNSFVVDEHNVIIYGTCKQCMEKIKK